MSSICSYLPFLSLYLSGLVNCQFDYDFFVLSGILCAKGACQQAKNDICNYASRLFQRLCLIIASQFGCPPAYRLQTSCPEAFW